MEVTHSIRIHANLYVTYCITLVTVVNYTSLLARTERVHRDTEMTCPFMCFLRARSSKGCTVLGVELCNSLLMLCLVVEVLMPLLSSSLRLSSLLDGLCF